VDARELVECSVFLAPMSSTAGAVAGKEMNGSGDEQVGTEEDRDEEVLDGLGLMVDRARDEDMSIVRHSAPYSPFYATLPIFRILKRVVARKADPRFNPHAMSPVLLNTTDPVLHNLPSSAINQLEKQYVGLSSMRTDQ
jgi:hypothetical protein